MKAIDLAWTKGWHRLWLECDSLYVVNLFRTKSKKVPWELKKNWMQCLHFLTLMDVRVSHIFREGNATADLLSKHSTSATNFLWWDSAPSLCGPAVWDDYSQHVAYPFS